MELLGTTKAIEVGTEVRIWADKDDPKTAARIAAGTARRPGGQAGRSPRPPAKPRADEATRAIDQGHATAGPGKEQASGNAQAPPAVARAIDQEIQRVLDADKIRPSGLADDAEFLRRVYLDITGGIPAAGEGGRFPGQQGPRQAGQADRRVAGQPGIRPALRRPVVRSHQRQGHAHLPRAVHRLDGRQLEPGPGLGRDGLRPADGRGQVQLHHARQALGSTDPQALFMLLNTEEGHGQGPEPGLARRRERPAVPGRAAPVCGVPQPSVHRLVEADRLLGPGRVLRPAPRRTGAARRVALERDAGGGRQARQHRHSRRRRSRTSARPSRRGCWATTRNTSPAISSCCGMRWPAG